MKLIVKGDDLGWTDGVNAGIEKAARDGALFGDTVVFLWDNTSAA